MSPARISDSAIIGKKYGRLTVTATWIEKVFQKNRRGGFRKCQCQCECGSTCVTKYESLKGDKTRSCGCLKREADVIRGRANATHGMTESPEWNSWHQMKDRCHRKNYKQFKHYGGRGIAVCARWRDSFESFLEDMGPRPSLLHSIDRIDNDGNYEPGNCRWATREQQSRNKRSNHNITFGGKTQCAKDWAKELGMRSDVLLWRIKNWGDERAFATPYRGYRRKP